MTNPALSVVGAAGAEFLQWLGSAGDILNNSGVHVTAESTRTENLVDRKFKYDIHAFTHNPYLKPILIRPLKMYPEDIWTLEVFKNVYKGVEDAEGTVGLGDQALALLKTALVEVGTDAGEWEEQSLFRKALMEDGSLFRFLQQDSTIERYAATTAAFLMDLIRFSGCFPAELPESILSVTAEIANVLTGSNDPSDIDKIQLKNLAVELLAGLVEANWSQRGYDA